MEAAITLTAAQERFLTHQRARGSSERSVQHYATTFKDFDTFLEATNRPPLVTTLKTEHIEAFAVWLKAYPRRPYKGSTQRTASGVAGHLRDTKAFINWCADPDQGFITWPVKVRLPKVPKKLFPIFAEGELVSIFQSRHLTGATEYATRNRALFSLLLDTGIRLAECARLTPKEIVGKQYVQIFGKGSRERLSPFSSATLLKLEAWLDLRHREGIEDHEALFLLNENGLRSIMRRISKDTGIHTHMHKWRHQSATMLVRQNADLHAVKRLLGHSSITVTEEYLSLSNEDLAAKHAAASPMNELERLLPSAPKRRRLKS